MSEILTVTDNSLNDVLIPHKPVLLLFSDGSNLRGEFSIAFKKAAAQKESVTFAQINPKENPQAVAQFNVGDKAVLVAYYNGEVLTRRSRPWGTDVPLAVELLESAHKAVHTDEAVIVESVSPEVKNDLIPDKENSIVDNKPVNVTDENFQTEVIDYHLPVVVDFWAEWCGPCRMVGPILDKLAGEYAGKLRIAKVDVDANPGLSQHFQVMSIPTIMMLKDRHIVFSQPGALPEPALRDLFDQLISLEIPAQDHEHEHETADESSS